MAQEPQQTHLNQYHELRDFKRHDINLRATLFRNRLTYRCRIRDYCLGGMLVIFEKPFAKEQIPILVKGEDLVIGFQLEVNRNNRWLRQKLRVARLVKGGCGVTFVDPSSEFIRSLTDNIKNSIQIADTDAEKTRPAGVSRRLRQLLAVCNSLTIRYLPGIYDEIYTKSHAQLLLHARDKARNNLDQNAIFDDILILEHSWSKKQTTFIEYMQKKLDRMILQEGDSPVDGAGATRFQLALVEQNEFEDWLSIAEMTNKVQTHYSELLYKLGRQYSILTRCQEQILDFPLGPDTVGHALQEILSGLGLRADVKHTVFDQAASVLISQLKVFYEELLESLTLIQSSRHG